MVAESKDSPEIIEFMVLLSRLKDWCEDLPDELVEAELKDSSISELCSQLWVSTFYLKTNERRHQSLFAHPVDPRFLSEFRDYEQRYDHVISHIELYKLFGADPSDESPKKMDRQRAWDYTDSDASDQAGAVNSVIEFAKFNIEQEWRRSGWSEVFVAQIEEGIATWRGLCEQAGFDLRGVLRRRALVPFVLVPRRVAAKHGSAEKLSLLTNLRQAHDAFVFGAPYAALALMRSILESVLRDHYGAEGKDLSERITNARNKRLVDRRIDVAALHRLRQRSNAILHLDAAIDVGLRGLTEMELESEILTLLYVLRDLIESLR
jgi:hypothetical protein